MKQTDGPALVNGVHVMEVQIDAMQPLLIKMTASYALVQATKLEPSEETLQLSNDGYSISTHGKCSAYPNNWSVRTMDKLRELIESMEEDLLPRHFDVEKKEEVDEGTADRGEEGPPQV